MHRSPSVSRDDTFRSKLPPMMSNSSSYRSLLAPTRKPFPPRSWLDPKSPGLRVKAANAVTARGNLRKLRRFIIDRLISLRFRRVDFIPRRRAPEDNWPAAHSSPGKSVSVRRERRACVSARTRQRNNVLPALRVAQSQGFLVMPGYGQPCSIRRKIHAMHSVKKIAECRRGFPGRSIPNPRESHAAHDRQ